MVGECFVMETVPLLARGVPARVAKLRAFGNSINPFNIVPIARAIQEADPVT